MEETDYKSLFLSYVYSCANQPSRRNYPSTIQHPTPLPWIVNLSCQKFSEDYNLWPALSWLNSLSATKNKRLLIKVVKTNWTHNNMPFLDTMRKTWIRSLDLYRRVIKKRGNVMVGASGWAIIWGSAPCKAGCFSKFVVVVFAVWWTVTQWLSCPFGKENHCH